MSRRLVLALAALLAITTITTGTTTTATAAKKPHGRLKIVVTGLAPGVKAHITAKRPHHKALKATRTKTFKKAAPGRYTITIHALPGYSRSAKKLTVRVKAHHRKTVKVHFTRLRLKFTQVTAGDSHTCAVAADHTAWCWGNNQYGQLGSGAHVGSVTANPSPRQVPGGARWSSLSAGMDITCGTRLDHTLWCWGSNQRGQLGTSTNAGSTVANPAPVLVPGGGVWRSVTASIYHTCAVKLDHTGWCWGANPWGELGVDPAVTDTSSTPVQQPGFASWRTLSAGVNHTCGIKTDGTVWCWGANLSGALGSPIHSGEWVATSSPLQVSGTGTWTSVGTGSDSTCGRRSDDTVLCWGGNWYGQLGVASGVGEDVAQPDPVQVSGGGTWIGLSLASPGVDACGIRPNHTAWCWGHNHDGQLGDGTSGNDSSVPVKVPGTGWSAITAGADHTCALKSGDIWCWGSNRNGQIGSGVRSGTDAAKSLIPIRVTAPWAVR